MSTIAERNRDAKRERKQVARYSNTDFEKPVIEGEGKPLREIDEVKAAFKSCPRDHEFLEIVHKALYGTVGKQDERRKKIMKQKPPFYRVFKNSSILSINSFLHATQPRVPFLHSLHTVSRLGLLISL